MAKYSFETKIKIVKAYLNGEASYDGLAKKYDIPSKKPIQCWVASYLAIGEESLMRSRKKEVYTYEFKLHVVELYLTKEVSYLELAVSVGISNPALICRWVSDYRIAGPDALRPKQRGRPTEMPRQKLNKPANTEDADNDSVYLRKLEEENLKLRIENAYLKELRRLRLEEEALLKRRRESSTASEENSD